jgi:hypothetical protein
MRSEYTNVVAALLVASGLFVGSSLRASASILTFDFSGAEFGGGPGFASGSLTIDSASLPPGNSGLAATNADILSLSFTTSDGITFNSSDIDTGGTSFYDTAISPFVINGSSTDGFLAKITDLSGNVLDYLGIAGGGDPVVCSSSCAQDASNGLGGTFYVGQFTEVTPLPAALPLFVSGLGAMGLVGWRRRRKQQAAAA